MPAEIFDNDGKSTSLELIRKLPLDSIHCSAGLGQGQDPLKKASSGKRFHFGFLEVAATAT